MAQATWEFEEEYKPGQPWDYNDDDLTYNQDEVDGLDVFYNSIGSATIWSIDTQPATSYTKDSLPTTTNYNLDAK